METYLLAILCDPDAFFLFLVVLLSLGGMFFAMIHILKIVFDHVKKNQKIKNILGEKVLTFCDKFYTKYLA